MEMRVTMAGTVDDLLSSIDSAGFDHATVVAGDGYRASIPLSVLRSGGVIAVEDGSFRLRVVDGTTLCWNVKDVAQIELTVGKAPDDVPPDPPH
jgi:hypothetical protein